MLPANCTPSIVEVSENNVFSMLVDKQKEYKSIVGHQDTADIIQQLLCLDIPFNRETIKLVKKDILVVAQYNGPRLEEGTTKLKEAIGTQYSDQLADLSRSFRWFVVTI
jgi:hypothetical protein